MRARPRQQGESRAGQARLPAWANSGMALVSVATPIALADAPLEMPRAPISFNELEEARLLAGKNKPGLLVPTHLAEGSSRTRISVHGVNASPDGLGPLLQLGATLGENASTFAYDDRFRRLEHSATDLAQALRDWRVANPGQTLVIDAHSMGGRVVLAALAQIEDLASYGPVELNLVAVPLAGYGSANWSRLTPGFLRDSIPVARPSLDMGSRSRFQKRLDQVVLPENVCTTIYVAGQDEVVDGADAHPTHIVNNLAAKVVHLPEVGHVSILGEVASRLSAPAE